MRYLELCTFLSTFLMVLTENINPYLKRFSRVNFNKNELLKNHEKIKRDIHPLIEFKFTAHEKTFDLKLQPVKQKVFEKDYIEIDLQKVPITDFQLYEGYLADEPSDSYVTGTIIGGIFTGTIKSKKDGIYYIEPGRKYNENEYDSIVFHEDDVEHKPKIKRSVNKQEIGCGISNDKVREALLKEQRKFGKQLKAVKEPRNTFESESFKYSKEANSRNKRQTGTFPEGRNVCNLYLKVDPYLYETIFNNEGNRNNIFTRNFLIYYLTKQVDSLNLIFNKADSTFFQNVKFKIQKLRIYQLSFCSSLASPENKICENFLDAITFLNTVSLDNFDEYCLSYTFTSRDFADGTLGIAWLASTDGTVGGICQKRTTVVNETKSLNSGIVTLVSFGSRVPERVNQITFAHEVGHSLGARHDPETSLCQPGGSRGNFIMFNRATSGVQSNNDMFSSCSIEQINSVFSFIISRRNCLKSESDIASICGNGIIEPGEVCDPGDSGVSNCCRNCIDLIGECDPSQGACCDPETCKFYTNEVVCLASNDCRENIKCTSLSARCPVDDTVNFKADLTLCNDNTQVCRSGLCTDSLCDRFDLKQCYLVGNLSDPKVNKSELCLLACTGAKTNNQCRLTKDIVDFAGQSYSLRPGSACSDFNGYCDIFSKCRGVDGQGSLARLANTLLAITQITIEDIKTFASNYWWAILLIFLAFLGINCIVFVCILLHINSDNPEKRLAYKFRQTLRHPFNLCRQKPEYFISKNEKKEIKKKRVPFEINQGYEMEENFYSSSSEINVRKLPPIQKIRKNPRQLDD